MKSTLLHIPHASKVIPERYLRDFDVFKIRRERGLMTDWFCDDLFDCGADRLIFPVSRLVCDVERFRNDRDEIMAGVGMGAVYERCSDLSVLRHISPAVKNDILHRYYDEHHRRFEKAVSARLAAFGQCLIIDCHSFYPSPLPYELDQSPVRPDFCIGTDRFHTPYGLTEALLGLLNGMGYSVAVNAPFAGTIVPMKYYGRDRCVISVMIEVNRRLYLRSPGVKNEDYPRIRGVLRECVQTAKRFVEK